MQIDNDYPLDTKKWQLATRGLPKVSHNELSVLVEEDLKMSSRNLRFTRVNIKQGTIKYDT